MLSAINLLLNLSCQTRYLRGMGFRIPFSISSLATQANQLYPYAVCLKESIKTYELTCQKVIQSWIFVYSYYIFVHCRLLIVHLLRLL